MRYIFLALCLLPGLAGCAGFYDEVTSRDFSFKAMFTRTDPLVVLRDSRDGDKRAKALRALREPKQNGGSDQDQELIVKLLVETATHDRQPLCRLAAIETLATFKDPRAVQGLTEAFYNANNFASETATVIRCQALSALGQTGSPAAMELLVRVVKEPQAEGSDQERQQALDVRIAAARALGQYNQPQSAEALVRVMRSEKNVALRDRAHESLQAATGKRLSPDDKGWDAYLQPQDVRQAGAQEEPNRIRRVLGLF
jgi:HEAT repeat protein